MAMHSRLKKQDLAGKVAVVTGASRGIGRAIALHLSSRGCSILGTYSSLASAEQFNEISAIVNKLFDDHLTLPNPKLVGIQADSSSADCTSKIIEALETHFEGKINILIHNAAMMDHVHVGQADANLVQRMVHTNLQTPLLMTDELVRREMFQPGSRIINISSDRVRVPGTGSLCYSASKAGLEALARTWALMLGGNHEKYRFMAGTTANSVSVGMIMTTGLSAVPRDRAEAFLADVLARQAVAPRGEHQWAEPDEVADVVGFLCSNAARWITGSVIPANGGHAMIQ